MDREFVDSREAFSDAEFEAWLDALADTREEDEQEFEHYVNARFDEAAEENESEDFIFIGE